MLRITIDLLPYGYETGMKRLGTATIFNDYSSEDESLGNYDVSLYRGDAEVPWRVGRVEAFPRQRLGPWDLLFRALAVTVSPDSRAARGGEEVA